MASPLERRRAVEALRAAIEAGTYAVDSLVVAHAVVADQTIPVEKATYPPKA